MSADIDTVLFIHVPSEWKATNYRYANESLAQELPPHVATVCVNRPVDFVVAPIKHTRKFLRCIRALHDERVSDRLRVITPRVIVHELLADKIPGLTALNIRMMGRQLRSVLKQHYPHARRLIQWIHHPHQRWVYDALPEAGKVYLCYDEYTCTPDGTFHQDRWVAEQPLLREAAVTFAVSEPVKERRQSVARRIELLPNGIPEFFLRGQPSRPDPIDSIPSPRIAYLGRLYVFLDCELLERVFTNHPEWHLVLIGPQEGHSGALRELPNVHFVGPRPHDLLPAILSKCQVGLLPFCLNEYSCASNFLKLYSYWAMGLSVVSTHLPQFQSFAPLIRFTENDPIAFADAIAESLQSDQSSTQRELQAKAAEFTWVSINRKRVVPVLREVFDF